MQHYGRNSLYWRVLIFLFKIQMTQHWLLPLSCSGSWSCNCLPALFHHDCLHKGVFIHTLKIPRHVQKFTTIYETPRFITAYTTARHLILSWLWSVHFMFFHNILLFPPPPMPPHVLVYVVVLPPGHGRSVTDFWGWGRPWGAVTLSRWCEWWYRM